MKPQTLTPSESGVILVNVLSVLALSSAVMVAILTLQDVSIERSTRFMDAAAASSHALGGETSAIVALRRDALEAPDVDHYNEAWAQAGETGAAIEGGTFRLVIEDEQGRFNINNLLTDGLAASDMLKALLTGLQAPPESGRAIADLVILRGGVDDLSELSGAGIDSVLIERLRDVACVLPESTDVNLNTADEAVLTALLGNRASARLLVSRRDRQGYLTPADISAARVILPGRAGFRSAYFRVVTTVTTGTAAQSLDSRIHRFDDDGVMTVAAWSRKRNAAAGRTGPPQKS